MLDHAELGTMVDDEPRVPIDQRAQRLGWRHVLVLGRLTQGIPRPQRILE